MFKLWVFNIFEVLVIKQNRRFMVVVEGLGKKGIARGRGK
jgi:hypothetical protein